jgi:Uma2 family endonuclease
MGTSIMSIGVLEEIAAGRLMGMPRLSVHQFERFIESGVLPHEVRCELLDGFVVVKNRGATGEDSTNNGARHAVVVNALSGELNSTLDGVNYSVRNQAPLSFHEYTQLAPDLVIIRGRGVDYLPKFPGTSEVALLIEVADCSLEADRGKKLEQYARQAVPVYWIVNLRENQIEIYTAPNTEQGEYTLCRIFREHETVEISIPDRETIVLSVRTILDGTL